LCGGEQGGSVSDRCRRTEEALVDFTKAIELEPDNAVYFHNRGFCLRNLDRYDAAVADYSRAIEIDDSDANFFNNRSAVDADLIFSHVDD
jgi:tetratricopeptide (TPR) repeat protein